MLSFLIPLTLPQVVLSQSLTTATSIQYFTALRPTTVYSTIQTTNSHAQSPVYLVMPANYNNKTGSFSLSQVEWVSSGSSSRNGGSDNGCRYYDYFLINATAGQEIRGHFEVVKSHYEAVVRSMDIFILTKNQLQVFKDTICGNGIWPSLMDVSAPSFDLDWIVPQSGEYALLFFSRDPYFYYNFYREYLYFEAKVYSSTVQTSSVSYTSTRTYTIQSNQIIVSTIPNTAPPDYTGTYYLVVLIAVIVVVLTVIIVRLRTGHHE